MFDTQSFALFRKLKKNLNDSVDAKSRTKTKEIVRKTTENIKNHRNNTGH